MLNKLPDGQKEVVDKFNKTMEQLEKFLQTMDKIKINAILFRVETHLSLVIKAVFCLIAPDLVQGDTSIDLEKVRQASEALGHISACLPPNHGDRDILLHVAEFAPVLCTASVWLCED